MINYQSDSLLAPPDGNHFIYMWRHLQAATAWLESLVIGACTDIPTNLQDVNILKQSNNIVS